MITKQCQGCSKEFITNMSYKKYCATNCRKNADAKSYRLINVNSGLPHSSIGALNELRAASDLISKGYYVFRSLTPNSPCDLIAVKDNKVILIEVKTTQIMSDGSRVYPKVSNPNEYYNNVAYVSPTEVKYIPELASVSTGDGGWS